MQARENFLWGSEGLVSLGCDFCKMGEGSQIRQRYFQKTTPPRMALSTKLQFPTVPVGKARVDLEACIRGRQGRIPEAKKLQILESVNQRGMSCTSDDGGVSVNDVALSPFELGLESAAQNQLLADLRNGTLCPKYKGKYGNCSLNIDPTSDEELQAKYPNLHGARFLQLENEFGIVDLHFLVSVIASDEERAQILRAPNVLTLSGTVNAKTSTLQLDCNGVVFSRERLWAGCKDAQILWYSMPRPSQQKRYLRGGVLCLIVFLLYVGLFFATFFITGHFSRHSKK